VLAELALLGLRLAARRSDQIPTYHVMSGATQLAIISYDPADNLKPWQVFMFLKSRQDPSVRAHFGLPHSARYTSVESALRHVMDAAADLNLGA